MRTLPTNEYLFEGTMPKSRKIRHGSECQQALGSVSVGNVPCDFHRAGRVWYDYAAIQKASALPRPMGRRAGHGNPVSWYVLYHPVPACPDPAGRVCGVFWWAPRPDRDSATALPKPPALCQWRRSGVKRGVGQSPPVLANLGARMVSHGKNCQRNQVCARAQPPQERRH